MPNFFRTMEWSRSLSFALLFITIIFYIQNNDRLDQKEPTSSFQECQPRYESNIRLFCFKDATDTGSWMLVYNEKGEFELLPTYNNTCWFKPKDLNFKKAVF